MNTFNSFCGLCCCFSFIVVFVFVVVVFISLDYSVIAVHMHCLLVIIFLTTLMVTSVGSEYGENVYLLPEYFKEVYTMEVMMMMIASFRTVRTGQLCRHSIVDEFD